MKKIFLVFLLLILTFAVFVTTDKSPKIDQGKISQASIVNYDQQFNLRQKSVECAAFTVSAVVRALTSQELDPFELFEDMSWKIPNYGIHPWGLEKELKKHNLEIQIPNLTSLNKTQKLNFLKQELSQKHPIILLGEKDGFQHYFTIFGFDSNQDQFYIYDSLHDRQDKKLTIDDNGSLPGNRTLSSEELIEFWSKGGLFGFYTWYLVSVSVVS